MTERTSGGLRRVKRAVLAAAAGSGAVAVTARSAWRRQRLAILCYHGVAMADEHEWKPALFVRPAFLRRRMELLRDRGYTVLPLDAALRGLWAGDLPPRSVALTFDDGTYDFYAMAWPILQELGLPATVYWTTYYAERPLPVFSVAYAYAQWKAGREEPLPAGIDRMNGAEKDVLLRSFCDRHGVDYRSFSERRILTIMRPSEVAELARAGCDFQLHTHRHRMPLDEEGFRAEIRTNRELIEQVTGTRPVHFCYPSGRFRGRFFSWLEGEGVVSATTTQPGVVSRGTPPFLVPRLVDHEGLSDAEFEAWVSGVAALLPRRTYWTDPDSADASPPRS